MPVSSSATPPGKRSAISISRRSFGRRSADVRFEATAVIGCFSSETARSRMTLSDTSRPLITALREIHPPLCWLSRASCHKSRIGPQSARPTIVPR